MEEESKTAASAEWNIGRVQEASAEGTAPLGQIGKEAGGTFRANVILAAAIKVPDSVAACCEVAEDIRGLRVDETMENARAKRIARELLSFIGQVLAFHKCRNGAGGSGGK